MKTAEAKRFKDNPSDLCQFYGTEMYHRDPLMVNMVYTDGVQHVAETRQAYWLIMFIYARYVHMKVFKNEPFITIEMTTEDDTAEVVFTDGNNNILHVEEIGYTDYPDEGVCMWLVDGVLMLPSEY
jgi:hypothetical protein